MKKGLIKTWKKKPYFSVKEERKDMQRGHTERISVAHMTIFFCFPFCEFTLILLATLMILTNKVFGVILHRDITSIFVGDV